MAWLGLALCSVYAYSATGNIRIDPSHLKSQTRLSLDDLEGNTKLGRAVQSWIRAIETDDEPEIFSEGNTIEALMKSLGTNNLFSVSDLAIAIGREELRLGRSKGALLISEHAIRFAPDNPSAHFFRAKVLLNTDKSRIQEIVASLAKGAEAMLGDNIRRGRFLSQLAGNIFLATMLAFMLTFLAQLANKKNALFADIAAFFPGRDEPKKRLVIGALVLVAPLALGGWLFFLICIPLFLWPYQNRTENLVTLLFAMVIIASPFTFAFMARGMVQGSAKTYSALSNLSKGNWDFETKRIIEEEHKRLPNDNTITFALGLIHELRGDKNSAIKTYDILLARNKNDIRALINKGNTYFRAREFKKAKDIYLKAAKQDKKSVHARFNLSSVYAELVDTKMSEDAYREARAIDSDMTVRFGQMSSSEDGAAKIIDFPITKNDLARYEDALQRETEKVSGTLWRVYFGSLSEQLFRNLALTFLMLLLASALVWRQRISHQNCVSCGAAFKPPVNLGTETPVCNQCVAVKVRTKGAISSAKKDKKRMDIGMFKDNRSIIAATIDRLLPGVGRSYYGYPAYGLLFTLITSLLLVFLFSALSEEITGGTGIDRDTLARHLGLFIVIPLYWFVMNTFLRKTFR
jgi:tetratricopeptide (TPR) repeat protein/TM2 domain-containing membrane protein YozV